RSYRAAATPSSCSPMATASRSSWRSAAADRAAALAGRPLPHSHGARRMSDSHAFHGTLAWQGQPADQPFTYETYVRSTRLSFEGGAVLEASSPAVFHGDDAKANPETLMMASLMQCHFLTFMAVAAKSRLQVTGYE